MKFVAATVALGSIAYVNAQRQCSQYSAGVKQTNCEAWKAFGLATTVGGWIACKGVNNDDPCDPARCVLKNSLVTCAGGKLKSINFNNQNYNLIVGSSASEQTAFQDAIKALQDASDPGLNIDLSKQASLNAQVCGTQCGTGSFICSFVCSTSNQGTCTADGVCATPAPTSPTTAPPTEPPTSPPASPTTAPPTSPPASPTTAPPTSPASPTTAPPTSQPTSKPTTTPPTTAPPTQKSSHVAVCLVTLIAAVYFV